MRGSDELLLERWSGRRDAEAFAEIIRRHSAMVYGTCLRVLRNASEAEDTAQECFVSLLRCSEEERAAPSSLGGWLHTVALRRAMDRLRSLNRQLNRDAQSASPVKSAEMPYDDLMECIDEAIAALPEELRSPVVAHFLEGRTQREVATHLGIPRRTVTSRIARGIEEVREYLRKKGVITSVVALTGALAAESAKAAPATLVASLGKLALSGVNGASAVAASASWGAVLLAWKKAGILAAAALLFVGGVYLRGDEWPFTPQQDSVQRSAVAPGHSGQRPHAQAPVFKLKSGVEELNASAAPAATPSLTQSAQPLPSTSPANDDKSATATAVLEGYVLGDGQPMAGVRVQIVYCNANAPVEARTARDGYFRVEKLRPGEVHATAGYVDDAQQFRYASRRAILEEDSVTRANFSFGKTGSVEGSVRLNGAPAIKGIVHLELASETEATENYDQRLDDEGKFRFEYVSEGNIHIQADAVGLGGIKGIKTSSLVLRAGETVRVDFDIDTDAGNKVVGQVVGLNPGERAIVYAYRGQVEFPSQVSQPVLKELQGLVQSQDGVDVSKPDFQLQNLEAGEYTVAAIAVTNDPMQLNDLLDWRAASGVVYVEEGQEARIDFDLSGGGATAPAIAGTISGLEPDDKGAIAVLEGTQDVDGLSLDALGQLFQRPVAKHEIVGPDFEMRHIPDGTYTVVAVSLKRDTEGQAKVASAVVEIVNGASSRLDLQLALIEATER